MWYKNDSERGGEKVDYPSFELMEALIKRLAEENGVQAEVRPSEEKEYPNMVLVNVIDEVSVSGSRSCIGASIEYSFRIASGPKIETVFTHFLPLLSKIREEVMAAIKEKLK